MVSTAFSLDKGSPILPLLGDFSQNTAHDTSRSHKAMTLAFQDPHLTPSHCFTQPLHIVDWNTGIFATMVDDDGARNVHVAEADGLTALEADEQVDRWVCVCGGAVPDLVCETGVVVALPLDLVFRGLCVGSDGCVASAVGCDRRSLFEAGQRIFLELGLDWGDLGYNGSRRNGVFGGLALGPARGFGEAGCEAGAGSAHEA